MEPAEADRQALDSERLVHGEQGPIPAWEAGNVLFAIHEVDAQELRRVDRADGEPGNVLPRDHTDLHPAVVDPFLVDDDLRAGAEGHDGEDDEPQPEERHPEPADHAALEAGWVVQK